MKKLKLRLVNFISERFLVLRSKPLRRKIKKFGKIKTLILAPKVKKLNYTIIYIHGGAYVFKLTPKHFEFIKSLAFATNSKVYAPLFGVIPKITIETLNLQLQNTIEKILEEENPKPIVIMGDSSGGGSICSLMESLQNHKLVTHFCLLSPFVRAYFSQQELEYAQKHDPILKPYKFKAWSEFIKTDIKDPQLNPLDKKVLGAAQKEIFLWYGDRDLLFEQIKTLVKKLREEDAKLLEIFVKNGLHVHPLFSKNLQAKFFEDFKNWISKTSS